MHDVCNRMNEKSQAGAAWLLIIVFATLSLHHNAEWPILSFPE